MLKNKNIYGIAILLILIVNIGFILAQEIEIKNEIVSFDSEKIDYKADGNGRAILIFQDDGGFVEINGAKFENILPADKSLNPSYMIIDNQGNILEADLTANEKGSVFLINGINFEAPPNSRVYYNQEGFFLENVKVSGIEENKFVGTPIEGKNVNLFDELTFSNAKVVLNKESYLVKYGEIVYENIEISGEGDVLIAKNPSMDLFGYKGNFIQHTNNGLNVQSFKEDKIDLRFLEGNDFFDIPIQEGNKESLLSMEISGGDKLEIAKKDSLIKGMPPLIKHGSSGQKTAITEEGEPVGFIKDGQTIINNGRHTFKFENGKYLSELGNLNAKNKLSVNFNLESDLLKDKAIYIDDENGYSIYEPKTGKNIFTFDKTLLNNLNYNFESEIGKKIYSFAEDQVGDSAFVWGGRGDVYYGEEKGRRTKKEKVPICGVKAYDCIGLPLTFLPKIYPENSLKDFPPNLQLVETLEKKGWSSFVVEPSNVVGKKVAGDSVKNIPPGSIVFLMHNFGSEDSEILEGIAQQKYLNSKNEEIILTLGHALIRGTGEKNFINAYPNTPEKELPKLAREYNEYLKKRGIYPFFEGTVREGEMVPEKDYLIVISPPKT